MTDFSWLVPLPVVLPLSAAGLTLALYRRPRVQRVVSVVTLSLVLVAAVGLLVLADDEPRTAEIGGWATPVGIGLVADRLSALMLTISAAVVLCVLIYSLAQGLAGEQFAPISVFHPTYLVLVAGVANAFLSGDLFNVYVGFEILLAASYVLITLGGTRERLRAGSIYVIVALLSSVLFLAAIAGVYAATGTLNLAQLALRLDEIDPGVRLVLQVMLLVAFAVKAAVFPLSAWLPDSYPTAPAPVTAVFAGLLTKVGIYAMLRTQTLLFPGGDVDSWLMVLALATMVIGILGAVAQDDIKRLLSFTLVSHIGFMVFGLALGSSAGWTAAIYYVAHHITVQTALFLVAGLMERYGGSLSLTRLGGLARLAPAVAILFFLPAMNLAGIPPLSGFLGKVGLLEAGVAVGTPLAWALVVGSVLTSLLTLYALVKAWNKAFWQEPPAEMPRRRVPRAMVGATGGLVAFSLLLTFAAGPLYGYAERAATALQERTPYISAVLPEGDRGTGESADLPDASAGDPAEPAASSDARPEPSDDPTPRLVTEETP